MTGFQSGNNIQSPLARLTYNIPRNEAVCSGQYWTNPPSISVLLEVSLKKALSKQLIELRP